MATLELIQYVPHRPVVAGNDVVWEIDSSFPPIDGLPQIFWEDGTPWAEANYWAWERATSRDIKLKTVQDTMRHLHKYAAWLEEVKTDWRHFPMSKKDRVLVRWRGALVEARKSGKLAPSTTTARMNATISFYRYAQANGFLGKDVPKSADIPVVLRYFDSVGFERSMQVVTTDISIPNRARPGLTLEDGLLPITEAHRTELLEFSAVHCNPELNLMLQIGFWTGARIGTITDLKIANLESARPDPMMPDIYLVRCGPGSQPYVETKFDVSGDLLIPKQLLDRLLAYGYDQRRANRQLLASSMYRGLIFLTRFGHPYARRDARTSPAINQEMRTLRIDARKAGLQFMEKFKFHQTRATYGTWLIKLCLKSGSLNGALEFVRTAMFHKDVSTTLKYIKFIEQSKEKIELANAFTQAYLGLETRLRGRNV